MLDVIGDVIGGLVELVARGIHALVRLIFRTELTAERPRWVKIVSIIIVVLATLGLTAILLAAYATYLAILVGLAAVAGLIALLGLS